MLIFYPHVLEMKPILQSVVKTPNLYYWNEVSQIVRTKLPISYEQLEWRKSGRIIEGPGCSCLKFGLQGHQILAAYTVGILLAIIINVQCFTLDGKAEFET